MLLATGVVPWDWQATPETGCGVVPDLRPSDAEYDIRLPLRESGSFQRLNVGVRGGPSSIGTDQIMVLNHSNMHKTRQAIVAGWYERCRLKDDGGRRGVEYEHREIG